MTHSRPAPICTGPAPSGARTLHLVRAGDAATLSALLGKHADFLYEQGFEGRAGQFSLLPAGDAGSQAVFCVGAAGAHDPAAFGALGCALPAGAWQIVRHDLETTFEDMALLGFCLGRYRYRIGAAANVGAGEGEGVTLFTTGPLNPHVKALAEATTLGRDLVNMPANLLGPAELAGIARRELEQRGAHVDLVSGQRLDAAYPCLSAVGAGSERRPVVVVARWSARRGAPRVSLVGKGVCFDTGGYDLKPADGMLRMKKDMGGAALMLAAMCAIIDAGLDVDVELRLGCVENSVSGHAMRPGDVLTTRAGKFVEVGNTDAEGRLVLCDLLSEASESSPGIIIDAATLTGAARVALGPDLPALFCNDDSLADLILESGKNTADPMWRMPLWHGYDAWLDSPVADLGNVTSQKFAGAITAALFLQRFVPDGQKWGHIDTYAWNDVASDARPAGGETLGLRAVFDAVSRYSTSV